MSDNFPGNTGINPPEIDPEVIERFKQKTGLSSFTIVDLLSKGWRWTENIGEVSRWEHPMWQIQDRKPLFLPYSPTQ